MAKIVLVNPPFSLKQRYGVFSGAGGIEVPSGLCYLASALREHEIGVEIIDAQALALDDDDVLKKIMAMQPRYVCFTATTPQITTAAKLAHAAKAADKEIITIIGGPHLSALPLQTLGDSNSFDIGVVGEGEDTLLELLRCLENKLDLIRVLGIVFRREDKVVFTGRRPRIVDIDSLPTPAYDLLPALSKHYYLPVQNTDRGPGVSLTTSRGCAGKCIFCDKAVFGNDLTFHSPEYLINMLTVLKDKHHIRSVMFQDDNFFFYKNRLAAFSGLLRKKRLGISWSASARVDSVDPGVLKMARDSGCWQISYGIESADQKILDRYDKDITLAKVENALRLTRRAGIHVKGFFIFGGPWETESSLRETLGFLRRADLDDISVTFFTPYPGTRIWQEIDTFGAFERDFDKMTCFDIVFLPRGLSRDRLHFYQKKALKDFYLSFKTVISYLKRSHSLSYLARLARSAAALLECGKEHEASARLIVSADDFGLSGEINQGVIAGYKNGIITSASIVANGDAFEEAVCLFRENPGLDIGWHLTLVEERALLPQKQVSSLVDEKGYFFKNWRAFMRAYFLGRIRMQEVREELNAQFAKIKNAGVKISHIDSHQHLHMLPGILKIVIELAKKHGVARVRYPYLPFWAGWVLLKHRPKIFFSKMVLNFFCLMCRRPLNANNFTTPQYYCNLSGLGAGFSKIKKFMTSVPSGAWEVGLHPAITNASLATRYAHWHYDWKQDLDMAMDKDVLVALAKNSIRLISFAVLETG